MHFLPYRITAALLLAAAPLQAQQTLTLARDIGGSSRVMQYAPVGICKGKAILSHGAGGSENGLAYMARFLQQQGWLVLVPGHAESGRAALREHMPGPDIRTGLAGLITDAAAYRARFADIAAAKAWADSHCRHPFTALIGHSMGAATVMLLAGARNRLGLDERIGFNAYVAMSPQGIGSIFPVNAWQDIRMPVYALTGTEDRELGAPWTSRLQAYRSMPPGCKWQGIVDGADHRAFGRGGTEQQAVLITGSVLAFLDAVRTGDCNLPYRNAGIRLETK